MSGNEVTKATSDVILTNDNLNGIIDAVSWGRHITDCVLKFVAPQLTYNIVASVAAFATAVLYFEVPVPVSKIDCLKRGRVWDKTGNFSLNLSM